MFQIRSVILSDGSEMLMVWLSRDPEEILDASRSHGNLTLASSFSSTLDQSGHSLGEVKTIVWLAVYEKFDLGSFKTFTCSFIFNNKVQCYCLYLRTVNFDIIAEESLIK